MKASVKTELAVRPVVSAYVYEALADWHEVGLCEHGPPCRTWHAIAGLSERKRTIWVRVGSNFCGDVRYPGRCLRWVCSPSCAQRAGNPTGRRCATYPRNRRRWPSRCRKSRNSRSGTGTAAAAARPAAAAAWAAAAAAECTRGTAAGGWSLGPDTPSRRTRGGRARPGCPTALRSSCQRRARRWARA